MAIRRSDLRVHKNGRRRLVIVVLLAIVIAVGFYGVKRLRATLPPTKKTIAHIKKSKRIVHMTAGDPTFIDNTGVIAFPLMEQSHIVNMSLFNRKTGTRRILFNRPVSIIGLAVAHIHGAPLLVFGMATEDTNRNGDVDDLDIHQLYYVLPESGEVHQFTHPIYNFISFIHTFGGGTDANGLMSGESLVYKVSVDVNHNGNWDRTDPIQYVAADIASQKLIDLLPDSLVPTTSIQEDFVEPDLR